MDAAVTAAVALTVVYPNQCSIGGDAIALVGMPDGAVYAVTGAGRSPRPLSPEWLGATGMPLGGACTVTVPGAAAAWETLADRWGSRPLADALLPAATLAADGVPVAPGLARDLQREQHRILSDEGMRAVFARDGRLLAAGDKLTQPRLAHTLTELAEGLEPLYRGDIGAHIIGTLNWLGSPMTERDLAEHKTEVDAPVSASYANEEYVTAPPVSQGLFFLQGLARPLAATRRLPTGSMSGQTSVR